MFNASDSEYDVKNGHDPVSLLPVEVVFTYLFLPITDAQFLQEGERERENRRFMEGCGGRTVCEWLMWKTGNP